MSEVIREYRQKVIEKLQEAIDVYNLPFSAHDVKITFDIAGRCAGRAGYKPRGAERFYFLQFNAEAVEKYNDQMIKDTIPHEVAHLVCMSRPELGRNHNPGWKRVCRTLGGDDSRTHDMELTPAKRVTRYTYVVNGREIEVGPKHHKKLQSGDSTYRIRGTGEQIAAHHYRPKEGTQVAPVAVKPVPPTTGQPISKKQRALAIYNANKHLPRGKVIELFVAQADLTPAGAATYYQSFKSLG